MRKQQKELSYKDSLLRVSEIALSYPEHEWLSVEKRIEILRQLHVQQDAKLN